MNQHKDETLQCPLHPQSTDWVTTTPNGIRDLRCGICGRLKVSGEQLNDPAACAGPTFGVVREPTQFRSIAFTVDSMLVATVRLKTIELAALLVLLALALLGRMGGRGQGEFADALSRMFERVVKRLPRDAQPEQP